MSKRTFEIEITATVTIEVDDMVIDVVDDEWRSMFYGLHTPEDIAEHIAYNLIVNRASLSQLDGWADQPDANAAIVDDEEWELVASEMEVTE